MGVGVPVNVRCPNCSAVFPVGAGPTGESQQVECPLCLLRFAPNAETTVSMPEMPAQLRGAAAPSPEDEFETFGAAAGIGQGRQGGPTTVATGGLRPFGAPGTEIRTTTFPPAAPPVAPVAAARVSGGGFGAGSANSSFEFGTGGSDSIDFEALLGDTLSGGSGPARGREADAAFSSSAAAGVGPGRSAAGVPPEVADPFAVATSAAAAPFDGFGGPPPKTGHALDLGDLGDFGGFDGHLGGIPEGTSPDRKFAGFGDSGASRDGLPPSGGDEGFSGFGGLDVAMDGSRGMDSVVVPLTAATDAVSRAASSRPEQRARRSPAISKAKRAYLRQAATAIVLLSLAVGLVGAALEVLGYGWFGRRLWARQDSGVVRTVQSSKAIAAAQAPAAPLWDTRATYEADISRLELLLKRSPSDVAIKRDLLDRYLDLYERFPMAVAASPAFRSNLDGILKDLPAPKRLEVIKILADGTKVADEKLAALADATPDDQALGVRLTLAILERKATDEVLSKPGLYSGDDVDSQRMALRDMPELGELKKRCDAIAASASKQANVAKFKVLQATLADHTGAAAEVLPLVSEIIAQNNDNVEARILAASAHLETGNLPAADALIRDAIDAATSQKLIAEKRAAYLIAARLAAKRGDHEKLAAHLQSAVDTVPSDEMTTVRLGRLLIADKRADEARKLLTLAKGAGMRSIGFEVVLVEFWLYVNRSEDALEELSEAGKLYPESVDLLFLRAQVEDKSAHFATARDLLAQVLRRDAKHLRATLRLTELLSTAGKHDEALAILSAARKAVGDDEGLLRLAVEELVALKREPEAREIAGRLLDLAPENHGYLLRAAQLDLRLGEVDRGLGYLRKLRDLRMLDRDAALQMGLALASKGKVEEGAQTVLPFAEQLQTDVELNVLAGRLLLDGHDLDRAGTLLQRAVTAANGHSPDAFFQFGRLAFARGENEMGISRIKQAIAGDQSEWSYRLTLAQALFDQKRPPNARDLAVAELTSIVSGAAGYEAAGKPVTALATVYQLLAQHFEQQHRFAQSAVYWKKVVDLRADDADALTSLGEALHHAASPDALGVLRQVVKKKPNDARAALYLGLGELNENRTGEALHWLEVATAGADAETVESWYHIALIRRERGEGAAALKAVEEYLKRAPKTATYRTDAMTLRSALRAGGAHN